MELKLYLPIIIGIILSVGAFYAMYGIYKSADKFFTFANELEEEIRTKDDVDYQLKCIYELKKLSFHRATSARLRELAKMMEIKYNIKLLKS